MQVDAQVRVEPLNAAPETRQLQVDHAGVKPVRGSRCVHPAMVGPPYVMARGGALSA